MTPRPVLSGPRCKLRPAQVSDATPLQDCFGHGDIFFGLGGPSDAIEDVERWLSVFVAGDPEHLGAWSVFTGPGCEVVGLVLYGDHRRDVDRLTVAFVLKESHRKRGLMTAALQMAVRHLLDQGVHRIEAEVEPANLASRRLLAGLGFRQEGGLMRDRIIVKGMRRSTLLFALLSPDFWMAEAQCQGRTPCAV